MHMKKKSKAEETTEAKISEVMSLIGKRSAEVRRKKWGKKEFVRKMRAWGKLGGRPRKTAKEKQ